MMDKRLTYELRRGLGQVDNRENYSVQMKDSVNRSFFFP